MVKTWTRSDKRGFSDLRPVAIKRNFTTSSPGSVLIEMGRTKVLCTATIDHQVPSFLENTGKGWVTSEYSMLPQSTRQRKQRERQKVDGRTFEIQRLIGRCLRAVVDLEMLGERTIWIDCDVLEADGGTRCASITGAYVALVDSVNFLKREGVKFAKDPIKGMVAAVSVGLVEGNQLLDLSYDEDSRAEIDMNIAMLKNREIVEIQGTAEKTPFNKQLFDSLFELACTGIQKLFEYQEKALK